MNVGFHIFLFLLFQVIANLLFKWGSSAPHLYWWGFGLGNLVGMSSILFMMGMYRALPVAMVVAVGTGGTFILNQVVMALLFRERVSFAAVLGSLMILAGVLMVSFLNHPAGR